jgi:hypothetical protein
MRKSGPACAAAVFGAGDFSIDPVLASSASEV